MPYQTDWINDPSRLKILEKSRRIGGTYSVSYAVFQRLMRIPNNDITVISRDHGTAVEFVRYVTKWCQAYNVIAKPSQRIPEKYILKGSIEIPHKNGTQSSRLLVASSNPDAAAGKGGDLILDEMAIHKDPEKLLMVAKPIITAGGSLTILSTHRSKNSKFNKLVKEALLPDSTWSHHKVTIEDAVAAGFVEQVVNPKLIEKGEAPWASRQEFLDDLRYNIINDDVIWDQEYMCIPSEEQYTLIPEPLCREAVRLYEYDPNRSAYLGWDIASSANGDYTCICIVQFGDDNSINLIHCDAQKGLMLEAQRDLIKHYVKEYKVSKLCLDATGIGLDSSQILTNHYGEHMCEGIVFGMQSKAEMAGRMLDVFQTRKITIPDDEPLIVDITSVEKIYSTSGNVTYHAPRTDGSHGDRFWGLALALKAAGWKKTGNSVALLKGRAKGNAAPDDRFSKYNWEERQRINAMKDRAARDKRRESKRLKI